MLLMQTLLSHLHFFYFFFRGNFIHSFISCFCLSFLFYFCFYFIFFVFMFFFFLFTSSLFALVCQMRIENVKGKSVGSSVIVSVLFSDRTMGSRAEAILWKLCKLASYKQNVFTSYPLLQKNHFMSKNKI